MRVLVISIILFLLANDSFARETLQFVPKLQNDELLEEGIELMHCICHERDFNWEISDSVTKKYYLFLDQDPAAKHLARVRLKMPEKEIFLSLGANEAMEKCKAALNTLNFKSSQPILEKTENPLLTTTDTPPQVSGSKFPWIAVGIGAALLGSFLLWKKMENSDFKSAFVRD